jgi:AmmeMemoRadiSam system protein A
LNFERHNVSFGFDCGDFDQCQLNPFPQMRQWKLAGAGDDSRPPPAPATIAANGGRAGFSHCYFCDKAKHLDNHGVQAILHPDVDAMKTRAACGKLPILSLTPPATGGGWRSSPLDARNRGGVSGETDRAAGGVSIGFHEPTTGTYTAAEKKFLLDLARTTLARAAANGPPPEISAADVPPRLAETKACFVTLTANGALRGCIGNLAAQKPLYQAVADHTQSAATRDWRFQPVQAGEVDKIKIEISVLTEPQPLRFHSPDDLLEKLRPRDDGVVLRIASRRATYLPQVWAQLPDKEDFLNHLSQKAGCDASAWRGQQTAVSVYHVEAFKESE